MRELGLFFGSDLRLSVIKIALGVWLRYRKSDYSYL